MEEVVGSACVVQPPWTVVGQSVEPEPHFNACPPPPETHLPTFHATHPQSAVLEFTDGVRSKVDTDKLSVLTTRLLRERFRVDVVVSHRLARRDILASLPPPGQELDRNGKWKSGVRGITVVAELEVSPVSHAGNGVGSIPSRSMETQPSNNQRRTSDQACWWTCAFAHGQVMAQTWRCFWPRMTGSGVRSRRPRTRPSSGSAASSRMSTSSACT